MLDRSFSDLMRERKRLTLSEIHPVTHQLLLALQALKGISIFHTDLKPDNIVLVNHKDQSLRVKFIDFCLALRVSKVGMNKQTCAYRAPEGTLGLPVSGAMSLHSFCCIHILASTSLVSQGTTS